MGWRALQSATVLAVTSLGLTGAVYAQNASDVAPRNPIAQSAPRSETVAVLSGDIAQLRSQGPAGLKAFLAAHQKELAFNPDRPTLPAPQLRKDLDALCQQRDCYASRFYWYTDLEQAKAAAKASNKPILSLRLLGGLDQELSCANSRFFRIVLYPNAQVSQMLRDRYILHWQSVRPVPKLTIDFGNGQKLERTLTGNSIHYVLDPNGRPIDALPGLYGPQAFLRELQRIEQTTKAYGQRPASERQNFLRTYHQERLTTIQSNWSADLSKLGIATAPIPAPDLLTSTLPDALEAGSLAVSKAIVESPIVSAIVSSASRDRQALEAATDEATWSKIAQLHATDARLDSNSAALMRSKNQALYGTVDAKSRQGEKTDQLMPVLRQFEGAIARDTVRNEYLLRTQLHQWFVRGNGTANVDTLNARVYESLFLTPNSDPWLGLLPPNAYSAIENDGIGQ